MSVRVCNGLLVRLVLLAAVGYLPGCSSSEEGGGTEVSVTVTAPTIVSPESGSRVTETQPTLTVGNATVSDGSTTTYTFQIATDSGFVNVSAQGAGVAQGASGQTSWQVTAKLTNGDYFWRAWAVVGATRGPYSSAAELAVSGAVLPGDTVVLSDPLTDGTTLGQRNGGQFTAQGWKVTGNQDYIRYEVHTISNGFVQWDNTGLTRQGANALSFMLFSMWDPSEGGFRSNPYRVNIAKLWGPTHNPPWLRMRWISRGQQHDVDSNFDNWDPNEVYTFRLQWGPTQGGSHAATLFLNGNEEMQAIYTRPYVPNTHWIEIGIAERPEAVINAVYSNVVIGTR